LIKWFLVREVEDDFVVLFTFLGLFKFLEICAADFSFLPAVTRALAVAAEGGGLTTGAGGIGVMELGELESHGVEEGGGGGGLEGTEAELEDKGVGSSSCLVSFPWKASKMALRQSSVACLDEGVAAANCWPWG
jgi:hypothetical protein